MNWYLLPLHKKGCCDAVCNHRGIKVRTIHNNLQTKERAVFWLLLFLNVYVYVRSFWLTLVSSFWSIWYCCILLWIWIRKQFSFLLYFVKTRHHLYYFSTTTYYGSKILENSKVPLNSIACINIASKLIMQNQSKNANKEETISIILVWYSC